MSTTSTEPLDQNNNYEDESCCMGMKKPGIFFRNLLLPEWMWDVFPQGLGFRSFEDACIYQPHWPEVRSVVTPRKFGLDYEEVWLTTSDNIKLHSYFIKAPGIVGTKNAFTIIFFHGNAGNIGDRLDNAWLLHRNLEVNVLMVDYRGYGKSEGRPTEEGLYKDAKAAFHHVHQRKDVNPNKIVVFGRSLGGAVAIDLCSRKKIQNKVAALIVENSFTSIPAMARALFKENFKVIRWVPRVFYTNHFNSDSKIKRVTCPCLFLTGIRDDTVPNKMMYKLYNGCGAKTKIHKIIDAGHNDSWCADNYGEIIAQFLIELGCKQDAESNYPFSKIKIPIIRSIGKKKLLKKRCTKSTMTPLRVTTGVDPSTGNKKTILKNLGENYSKLIKSAESIFRKSNDDLLVTSKVSGCNNNQGSKIKPDVIKTT